MRRTDYLGEIADEAKVFFTENEDTFKELYIKEAIENKQYGEYRKGVGRISRELADDVYPVDTSEKAYNIIAESRNADDVPMDAPENDGSMSHNDMLIKMAQNITAFTAEHVFSLETMKKEKEWEKSYDATNPSGPGM